MPLAGITPNSTTHLLVSSASFPVSIYPVLFMAALTYTGDGSVAVEIGWPHHACLMLSTCRILKEVPVKLESYDYCGTRGGMTGIVVLRSQYSPVQRNGHRESLGQTTLTQTKIEPGLLADSLPLSWR